MEILAGIIFIIVMLFTMLLPFLMFGFMIFAVGFWVWMLIDSATNQKLTGNDKLMWVLIVVFANWIGALIYFFIGRKQCQATPPTNPPPPIPARLPPPVPARRPPPVPVAITQQKEYPEF